MMGGMETATQIINGPAQAIQGCYRVQAVVGSSGCRACLAACEHPIQAEQAGLVSRAHDVVPRGAAEVLRWA